MNVGHLSVCVFFHLSSVSYNFQCIGILSALLSLFPSIIGFDAIVNKAFFFFLNKVGPNQGLLQGAQPELRSAAMVLKAWMVMPPTKSLGR